MTLSAVGIRRSFGKHVAVAHADLTLSPGRITGLVGPNGAGKTTLLLMLAGLLAPDSGDVTVDGIELTPTERRRITGWMPDVFGTWESLTAREILTTFGQLYGQRGAVASARADELLELVHLSEFAQRPAHVLSRGQKQRLGFARALVNHPRILLLDEPASGMDPRSRRDLRDQLRALANSGCTILVSSHILGELAEMVDDVVIMTDGHTRVPRSDGGVAYRLRAVGQSDDDAATLTFPDEATAADHLAATINQGIAVAEFTRTRSELEDAYLALEPERR